MIYILVFLLALVDDLLAASYIKAVSQQKAALAGVLSVSIVLVSSLAFLAFIHDYWCIVPEAIGAFLGTYWITRKAPRQTDPDL